MTTWNDPIPEHLRPKPQITFKPGGGLVMPRRKAIISSGQWRADAEARDRGLKPHEWVFVHSASSGVTLTGMRAGHVIVAKGTHYVGGGIKSILRELLKREHVLVEGLEHLWGWR